MKPNSDFYAAPKLKSGLHSWCKSCVCAQVRERQKETPEQCRARKVAYYERNSPSIRAQSKKWRSENPEQFRILKKRWDIKQIKTLSDSYIASQLKMKASDLPRELIEAKRIQLKIKRYLKNGN